MTDRAMESYEERVPALDEGGPIDRPHRPMPESFLERPVFSIFAEAAESDPGATAICSARGPMTYGGLLARAKAIGLRLMEHDGDPAPVAIAAPVEWEFIAAMLGCLAAGRPYVPLDVRHPKERWEWILEHSGASLVLAGAGGGAHALAGRRVDDVSGLATTDASWNGVGKPESNAYIIYTSGSTGRPKGVFQDQRGLVHDVLQYTNSIHLGPEDVTSLLYSPTVSGAIRDIYGALLNGGCLCMSDLASEGWGVVTERGARCGITILHAMPPVLRSLLKDHGAAAMVRRARLAYVAGDRFMAEDLQALRRALPERAFVYTGIGSTECATLYRQWFVPANWMGAAGEIVPAGRAVPGRGVCMATPEGHPVPQGEAGVIHVHGRHLALGYWRDPDLTRASFAGPDAPGAWRRFVTGDVGRVREDGLLEFHGRSDRQVKVRGFRVEPAEAESALRKLEGVRDAAVVVVAHRGENRLVAFVEAPDDKELDEARLVEQAMSGLPPHLLPARLVKVSSIPRLPNFKVDHVALSRQALESMDAPATPGLSDGPRPAPSADPVAAQILEEWERVLGRQLPGVDVPWRDTGGDSLMALEVLSAVERRIGCRLSSEILQANASPAWMARQVQRGLHLRSSGTSAHSRLTGKLWVITSLHAATVHDRRIVEGLAGDVDGDIVAITSLDDELESVRSLEELAGDCARTIVEQTEKGVPVHLLGLSFGGRIALHAAHLLRQRGVQVGLVGIGDIPCAAKDVRFLAMNRVQRHGDEPPTSALRRPWITAARLAKASVRELVAWATSRRWTWLIRCLVRPGRQALGDRFASAMRFAIRQGQVMGWKAPRLEGEVTLFVSRETGEELSYLQPTLGWEGHADLVARVDVAGSHTSYHRDENTAGFVAAVRGRLLHHANQSRKVTLPC